MSLLLHTPLPRTASLSLGLRAGLATSVSLKLTPTLSTPLQTLSTPLGSEAVRKSSRVVSVLRQRPPLQPLGLSRKLHTSAISLKPVEKPLSSLQPTPADEPVLGSEGPHFTDELQQKWTLMNPIYTEADLDTVVVVGREPVTVGDKAAHGMVKMLRTVFDLLSGYVAKPIPAEVLAQDPVPIEELRKKGELLSDKEWLRRIILLESIAGVPGMVGGTLRHLRSLRLLRRDGGWIHTLLEEAENERMHLLTFLSVSNPTYFTRALVMAGQGVFYCAFFLTYLVHPRLAHRFVGALEEEAVRTYTHCIDELEKGLIPEWKDKPAPQIAIDYWRMPDDSTLLDVIKAVRADEATHRFVNHSLANLDQAHDFNPFALAEPTPQIRGTVAGFTRDQSAEFARQTQAKMVRPPESGEAHPAARPLTQ